MKAAVAAVKAAANANAAAAATTVACVVTPAKEGSAPEAMASTTSTASSPECLTNRGVTVVSAVRGVAVCVHDPRFVSLNRPIPCLMSSGATDVVVCEEQRPPTT